MAQYQRGMKVAAKVSAKSVKVLTRKMTVSAEVTATAVAVFTRKMSVSAKVTAVATPKGTRGIVEPGEFKPSPTAKGTRGMVKAFDGAADLDPWGNYRFALYLNLKDQGLIEVAHFMECSGLKNVAEVFEIREGGLNGRTHKRPGQGKWENIVLRYGASGSNALAAWRDRYILDGFTQKERTEAATSTGAIVLMDNSGKPLRRYEFKNAWPVSWEGPSLNSGGSDLAVETLEIAHEGLKVVEEEREAGSALTSLTIS
jgi:phage tail-like protein